MTLSTRTGAAADGVSLVGRLTEPEQELLGFMYAETLRRFDRELAAERASKEVFWINLWQRSGDAPPVPLERSGELDAWVREVAARHYDERIDLDGYGFSINPCGSRTQAWHLDYSVDYSNIFIPLSAPTPDNALQYVAMSPALPEEAYRRAIVDPDVVDVAALLEGSDSLSIRQLLTKPFSLLKLDFGTIHRGISNTASAERVMFYLSVKRPGEPLPVEPLVQHSSK